jgi:thymidylate synthase ThyX
MKKRTTQMNAGMIKIEGKEGISTTIIKDSISPQGIRLVTFELVYPRIIHSELMTHRMLSKNAASSRAIPFAKMQEQLTGRPVRFGQANPGMQDKGEDFTAKVICDVQENGGTWREGYFTPEEAWDYAREMSMSFSQSFYDAGYAKQVFNRLTEPFQMMKTLVSGTEWANFFWLRNDVAADPTLHELAHCMKEAYDTSVPTLLQPGEWHLPYVGAGHPFCRPDGNFHYWIEDEEGEPVWLSLEEAKKVSAARCAAVSFRNTDYDLKKSLEVYDRLVGDERKHASAFEHQATPMQAKFEGSVHMAGGINYEDRLSWEAGVSHMDRQGNLWSGNFKGWIQHRKLIPGENKEA